MLALKFGTTTTAMAIVLAVFMAGLGLGGLYFGYRADRAKNPSRLCALCSFGTAFSALIVFFAIDPSSPVHAALWYFIKQPDNSLFTAIIVSIILLVVPTFFMGAFLPLLSRMYISHHNRIGNTVSWLYATQTLGNIAGAFLTGYVLIIWWGQTFTHVVAMMINVGTGILLLSNASFSRYEIPFRAGTPVRKPASVNKRTSSVVLVIAGITGFCALALEVLWTRILRTYAANYTYTFTNIIIVYLGGVFLGSLLFYHVLHRRAGPGLLSACQLGLGLYTLVILLIVSDLPTMLFGIRGLLQIPLLRILLPGMVLSAAIALVPTVCMGITFPLLVQLHTQQANRLGQSIGRILFINMCGAIIGSCVAHFILINTAGVIRSLGFIALLSCSNALLSLIFTRPRRKRVKRAIITGIICSGALLLFILGFQHSQILPPSISRSALRSEKVIFYRETYDGTVLVTEDLYTGIRACYINNNAVCGTTYDALKVVRMLGHLPYLYYPEAQEVCVIGFGTGITTSALAQHNPTLIDCIEICPGVADAARFFESFNHNVLAHNNVHLIPGDGRTHLLTTRKQYDIISCDPTHPALGCNALYTKEYFQLCRTRLSEGGIICQYLPLHKLSLDEFIIAIRTFRAVFPNTSIWLAHAHAIMVGTLHEQTMDFVTVTTMLDQIDDDILHDPYDLASSLILDETAVHHFVGEGAINTDNHPYLEFFTPASTAKGNWDRNLYQMLTYRIPPVNIINNISEPGRLEQYIAAQQYFLSALIFKNQGKLDDMLRAMEIAHRINPASEEIRLFLEHERAQRSIYQ